MSGNDSVTFAPEGAYYRGNNGSTGFTHGVQVGVIPNESHDHSEATDELDREPAAQGNPQIRRQNNGYIREIIDGRTALSTTLRNVSEVTGGCGARHRVDGAAARRQPAVSDRGRAAGGGGRRTDRRFAG